MNLVTKYNQQVPRYTSYPTVPYWENNLNEEKWIQHIKQAFTIYNKQGISLYIHLPFCESLCTYCACNTRITINHKVEKAYIDNLLKEWVLYLKQFNDIPNIKEIHLGGGTPTFFSPENLKRLITGILNTAVVTKDYEFSFEGHPSNTTNEHLQVLFDLGFKRVSFGIQDFDLKVQTAINRLQTYDEVKSIIENARRIGYTSINLDVIYGLPHQTADSVSNTIKQIISLKPERIAFYSYAHVPWLKPGQRKYSEKDLPIDSEKRKLYEIGKSLFKKANYLDVGMDHFALKDDALFTAYNNDNLHRNFMGYTPNHTKLMVGLGCSSISDTWDCFSQNIKTVEEYQAKVEAGHFPIMKGHVLNQEDLVTRQHMLNLMCKHETELELNRIEELEQTETINKLNDFVKDGLAEVNQNKIVITEQGKNYLRNICLAFDKRYWKNIPKENTFSTTA